MALTLAAAPVYTALAESSFTGIQYEFALGKKLELRQVNLTFQKDAGRVAAFELDQDRQDGIAIPLYSANPQTPAVLNLLNASETKKRGKSGPDAGSVVSVVLGLGLLGLLLYAAGKCFSETASYDLNEPDKRTACDDLSDDISGLGGFS